MGVVVALVPLVVVLSVAVPEWDVPVAAFVAVLVPTVVPVVVVGVIVEPAVVVAGAAAAAVVTVVVVAGADPEPPARSTSAAAIAPRASATTTASAASGGFQFGEGARRVRAAEPQRRHQLCSRCSGAPQTGHGSPVGVGAGASASCGGEAVALTSRVPGG